MAIRYGTHDSARQEAEFIHVELAKQVQAGHVAVFSLEEFTALLKPVSLACSGHPLGGKEATPYFLLYMESYKRHSIMFSPHGGDALQWCAPSHPQEITHR